MHEVEGTGADAGKEDGLGKLEETNQEEPTLLSGGATGWGSVSIARAHVAVVRQVGLVCSSHPSSVDGVVCRFVNAGLPGWSLFGTEWFGCGAIRDGVGGR